MFKLDDEIEFCSHDYKLIRIKLKEYEIEIEKTAIYIADLRQELIDSLANKPITADDKLYEKLHTVVKQLNAAVYQLQWITCEIPLEIVLKDKLKESKK